TVQNIVNLNPNETSSSGSCGKESATLILKSGLKTELTFTFTLVSLVILYTLIYVGNSPFLFLCIESFSAHNDSLDYLQGSLGFSYMCRSEQTLKVSSDFSLNTYLLHVQPFGLTGDSFGS
ncbi:hypothetical protein NL108_007634, partial [Boleophthalmus pectinirostris]